MEKKYILIEILGTALMIVGAAAMLILCTFMVLELPAAPAGGLGSAGYAEYLACIAWVIGCASVALLCCYGVLPSLRAALGRDV